MTLLSTNIQRKSIGIASYTYRDTIESDINGTLDNILSLGIKNLELSSLHGYTAIEMRKILDKKKIKCISLGASYEDVLKKIDWVGDNAVNLGAKYVQISWIHYDNDSPFSYEEAVQSIKNFNKIGKRLKEKFGVTFCYHNHGYEYYPYQNETLLDYIIQNTAPQYVAYEMDIFWTYFGGGDPINLLKKYPNRFILMHLKNIRRGVKGDLTGLTSIENDVALDDGQLDVKGIIKVGIENGVKHLFIEDESSSYRTQVPRSIHFLKSIGVF